MSAPAGAITRSSCARCRSPRCRGRACCSRPKPPAETRSHLIAAMVELARRRKLSSLHVNFPRGRGFAAFAEAGFLQRIGQQFHWTNDGYRDFDDYLAALNSRKRKAVKKERREALAGGIEIEMLTGADLHRAGLGRVLPVLSRRPRTANGARPI